MDKIAANNHIVTLKKELKKAKAMVNGNLIRKIKELKAKKEKLEDDAEKIKIDTKVERIYAETKLFNAVDTYTVAKNVTLKPDKKIWEELLSNNKASPTERLTCRIVLKNNVQKCVNKFRTDNKECDEWLEEYFEFREKKRQLKDTVVKKPIRKKTSDNQPTKQKSTKSKESKKTKSKPNIRKHSLQNRTKLESADDKALEKNNQIDELHPSWASKRKEKELLKAALSNIH